VAGAALAVPAVVYLVLLVSSVLGGPRPGLEFVPLPGDTRPQSDVRPKAKPTPVPAEETSAPVRERSPENSKPVASESTPGEPTTATTGTPAVETTPHVTPTVPTTAPTTAPTVTPTTTITPTTLPTTPTDQHTPGHGKPTAPPPGQTKTPPKP
jgi:hypothetical protein